MSENQTADRPNYRKKMTGRITIRVDPPAIEALRLLQDQRKQTQSEVVRWLLLRGRDPK